MLSLIGLGLWNEKDITLKGLERAQESDKVYIELYTSHWHGNVENLGKKIKKNINILKREDLEEKSDKILEEAKKRKVVILVPGDPLIATTHTSLISNAIKDGIVVEVIHNASIYSAVAETGLHAYKFGASATIPLPEKTSEVLPLSTYETLKENNGFGLHTLLFLDVASDEKYMTPGQAIKTMLKLEGVMKQNLFTYDTEIIVFGRAGSDEPIILYGKIKDLLLKNFGEPPFVIIVPGKLHFTEKEFLEYYEVEK
jgi:diphthine synthase